VHLLYNFVSEHNIFMSFFPKIKALGFGIFPLVTKISPVIMCTVLFADHRTEVYPEGSVADPVYPAGWNQHQDTHHLPFSAHLIPGKGAKGHFAVKFTIILIVFNGVFQLKY